MSQALWLTDTRFLNDPQERDFGRARLIQFVNETFDEQLKNSRRDSLRAMAEDFRLRHSSDRKPQSITDDYSAVYCVSFCEEGDLLSQWRGYGDFGKGYALGIRSTFINRSVFDSPILSLKRRSRHLSIFGRVLYDEERQREIAQAIVADAERFVGDDFDPLSTNLTDLVETWINVFSVFVKAAYFSEEREMRLVIFHRPQEPRPAYKVRGGDHGVIPYVEFSLNPLSESIGRVVVGPRIAVESTRKALSQWIHPDHIRGSAIQLR